MANEEHVQIIRQGVEVWNDWRQKNPEVVPDLSKADLSQADLSGVDFSGVLFNLPPRVKKLRQSN